MPAPASSNAYPTCPLRPVPEPPRVLSADPIAAARIPSNACTGSACAWFITQMDPVSRKVVGGACSLIVIAHSLVNLSSVLGSAQISIGAKPGEAPSSEKPS